MLQDTNTVRKKALFFKVIKFCIQEKSGVLILLNIVNDRITHMLGISE